MINYIIILEKNMIISPYICGFFYVILGVVLSILIVRLLKRIKSDPGIKNSFYEQKQTFTFQTGQDFNIYFYGLGLLFLIFISFSIFLFLWVLSSESSSFLGFLPMIFILGIFCCGYVYGWKKGMFE